MPEIRADVVVIGGGSAGMAAAHAAAASGCSVLLLERYGFLGGMATTALVGTVCGLYMRSEGPITWANHGLAREFGTSLARRSGTEPAGWRDGLRFLPYDPLAFRLLADALTTLPDARTLLHTTVCGIEVDGDQIRSVEAIVSDRAATIRGEAFIDCTGAALVHALADQPLADARLHQAPAFVFSLEGLPPVPTFNLRMMLLKAVKTTDALPHDAEALSIVPGTHHGTHARLKLGIRQRVDPVFDATSELERRARSEIHTIVDHLRRHLPGFEAVRITDLASQLGVRSARRPVGRHTLSDEAVLGAAPHPEGIAAGAWPIELWSDNHSPELRTFAEGCAYQIPAGCLESSTLRNLWFAGRHISASDLAIASARVIGTCIATGFAAGTLAAYEVQGRTRTDAIQTLRRLQLDPP